MNSFNGWTSRRTASLSLCFTFTCLLSACLVPLPACPKSMSLPPCLHPGHCCLSPGYCSFLINVPSLFFRPYGLFFLHGPDHFSPSVSTLWLPITSSVNSQLLYYIPWSPSVICPFLHLSSFLLNPSLLALLSSVPWPHLLLFCPLDQGVCLSLCLVHLSSDCGMNTSKYSDLSSNAFPFKFPPMFLFLPQEAFLIQSTSVTWSHLITFVVFPTLEFPIHSWCPGHGAVRV